MTGRIAPLVIGAILLAACGGDDGGEAEPTATSGPATTITVPDPAEVPAEASSGCGTSTATAGERQAAVVSGGDERAYGLHVPPAHDGDTPVPVVVDYHGYYEGGPIHAVHSALGPYGAEEGFVTVTPDSGYPVPRWDLALDGRDVALFADLLDQLETDLCVDTNRVFVTGLSNGAFLTSALACAHGDRITATAPVAGIRDIEDCAFDRPVPVVAFHGTEDTFVAFDGGLGSSVADLPSPDGSGTLGDTPEAVADGPSIPEVIAAWADRNGCEPEPTEEVVADDVTRLAFACPPGAEAELYVVDGGGHTWPGSEFSAGIESIVGPTTFSIVANEVMWSFFQAHPLSPT